jgi:hypothetical protein
MLVLLCVGAGLSAFVITQRIKLTPVQAVLIPQTSAPVPESNVRFQAAKNERYVYPYSVIPGGWQ